MLSQLHIRMLLLTVLPFILSLALWGLVLWLGLQPLIDSVQHYFTVNDMFGISGSILSWFSMGAFKAVLVPLIAMWALLPLMILTALVFVALIAVPAVLKHVAGRHYAHLTRKFGGSWWGTLWTSLWCFLVFSVVWLLTLPLFAVSAVYFVVHQVLRINRFTLARNIAHVWLIENSGSNFPSLSSPWPVTQPRLPR